VFYIHSKKPRYPGCTIHRNSDDTHTKTCHFKRRSH
jgi:hypothetical protein